MKRSYGTALLSIALALAGVLLPSWPLSLAAVVLAALSAMPLLALLLGLMADLMFGAPQGIFALTGFPFALCALAAVGVRALAMRFFIEKTPQNTL